MLSECRFDVNSYTLTTQQSLRPYCARCYPDFQAYVTCDRKILNIERLISVIEKEGGARLRGELRRVNQQINI